MSASAESCSLNRENNPEPGSPLLRKTSTQHDGALELSSQLESWLIPRSAGLSILQKERKTCSEKIEGATIALCHVMPVQSNRKMQGASGGSVVDQSSSHFPQPPSWSTWHPECVPSASVCGYRGWWQCPSTAAPALYPTRQVLRGDLRAGACAYPTYPRTAERNQGVSPLAPGHLKCKPH